MRLTVGKVPEEAVRLLADVETDASGVGVNYADAYLKVFKQTLADGRKLVCRRRGLKITLTLGERSGESLLRRLEQGPDVRDILHHALLEGAAQVGASLSVEDGTIYLDCD